MTGVEFEDDDMHDLLLSPMERLEKSLTDLKQFVLQAQSGTARSAGEQENTWARKRCDPK